MSVDLLRNVENTYTNFYFQRKGTMNAKLKEIIKIQTDRDEILENVAGEVERSNVWSYELVDAEIENWTTDNEIFWRYIEV